MRRLVFIWALLIFAFQGAVANSDILQKKAAEAYTKGDFNTAAQIYESMLRTDGVSAGLFYNLGNAYYKQDEIPKAILNYERALLLSPGDEDIQHNIEIAKLKTVDKITPVGRFIFTEWVEAIRMQLSSDGWAIFAVVTFLLFIASLFIFFFAGRLWMKKSAFFGGIAFLLICLFANFSAYTQKSRVENRDHAIVFTPSIVVKSTPDDSGTDLFVIHQGLKVKVIDKVRDWVRVELEDGNDGWIKSDNLQII